MSTATINTFSFAANDTVAPAVKLLLTYKFSNGQRLVMQTRGDKYVVYYAFKTGPMCLCSGMQTFNFHDRAEAIAAFNQRCKSISPAIAPAKISVPDEFDIYISRRKHIIATRTSISYREVFKVKPPAPSLISRCEKIAKRVVCFVKKLFS